MDLSQEQLERSFSTLVKAIFPASLASAKAAVAALDKKARGRISSILDIAAGSAAWSIPFAQAIAKARITVIDFPGVMAVARQYPARLSVADRYDYVEGDIREGAEAELDLHGCR